MRLISLTDRRDYVIV